jgi:hypothetical protein
MIEISSLTALMSGDRLRVMLASGQGAGRSRGFQQNLENGILAKRSKISLY